MKIFRILCLIGWASFVSLSLQAQKKVHYSFQYAAEASAVSELKELTQVSYPGTSSIRLYFEEVRLGTNSYLLLEGSDGAKQKMNAAALQNWSNSSAYFNGQNVKVSVYQAQGEAVVIKLKEIKVNEQATNQKIDAIHSTSATQARTTAQGNLGYWAEAVGRFTNGEQAWGTGWIAANGAIVTDNNFGALESFEIGNGNYLDEYDIIEFNVPPSNADGTVNHPAPEDQYPLNKNHHFWWRITGNKTIPDFGWISFFQVKQYGRLGRDLVSGGYTIIEAFPNGTGKRPGERIGKYFQVIRHNNGINMQGTTLDLLHYGFQKNSTTNQTLQKKKVVLRLPEAWIRRISDKDRFLVYDNPNITPDSWDDYMEGGVLVYPNSNVALGIHSEGSGLGDSPAVGTGFRDQGFRKHLGEFFTTDVTYVDRASSVGGGNGNIYEPYLTVADGVAQAADHDILNIARGSYNESVTINKPLKISAPVGAVIIGATDGTSSRVMQPTIPASLYGDDPSDAFAEEEDLLVDQASLSSFPNPFRHHTELHYTLRDDSPVQAKVYDMLGQEVQTLVEEEQLEGGHRLQWDGRNQQGKTMPPGIYIMQLNTGGGTSSVRVMKQ